MTAYLAIVRWELRYYLRRISTWVYFGIFTGIAFFFMLAAGGAWGDLAVALGSGGKVAANAPFALSAVIPILSLFGVSITAALAGNALYKDYAARSDPLFYTTPVSKGAFFGGRFTAALIVNVLVLSGIGIGAYLGTVSPWVQADKIAPFRLMAYVQPYLGIVLPNLVLTAAIFFALVALTRQMIPNYVGGALLLVGYLLAGTLVSNIENKQLAALVDPFGLRAQQALTEYWSIAEKNTRLVPIAGPLLENRLLWLGVAAAIFLAAFVRFRFAYAVSDGPSRLTGEPPAVGEEEAVAAPVVVPLRRTALPATTQHFDVAARAIQFRSIWARAFWRIVRSPYFGAIVAGGLLYLVVAARAAGALFGTQTWPVTYQIENVLSGSFGLFVLVIIAFYAGELVWAERDADMDQLYDATPVSTGVSFAARFVALGLVIALLLVLTMLAGIATQAARGYYHFEIGLYLQALFGFRFVDYLLVAALAMAIHVVVNHKYAGHFFVILLYVGISLLPALGLEHGLYQYGSDSGYTYSDMNGWGPYVWPFVWWKVYWGAFAFLLLLGSALLWVRGGETDLGVRWRLARERLTGGVLAAAIAGGIVFAGAGLFIFYNTNILNTYRSPRDDRHLRAERERRYRRFLGAPQPRIVGINVHVDLQPRRGDALIDGQYVLRNETPVAIDSLHLAIAEDLEVRRLAFDRPSRRVLLDRPREYAIYRLARPLAPGDSLVLRFTLARIRRGFPHHIEDLSVVEDGTFLENAAFMPTVGYDPRLELQDDDARKKEKLPPRPRMEPPTDPTTWRNNYISHDADWLDYEAVVSTDTDQTALTSGRLVRTWTEGGRRYFHYKMDAPILNLWAFQSGRYAIRRDRWIPADGDTSRDVAIAVLYHPAHAYNVARMIDAMKKSLDYYTTHFGPYQHRELDIVEFPRYETFAQSLPNTIPFSEAIGFIARVKDASDVDYPFYVTAHEVAHQWWAHQVIGADAQGSTMLSETMAQYSALMVMEHEFGAADMRRFLEDELDQYLLGRSTERDREQPLELGENQPYIHYNKGAIVMYAMRDYLGEARMNAALRGFLDATKFKGPPYPTSLQLVAALRAATPDSLKYLIGDLFEHITLDELKTDSVLVRDTSAAGGRYAVDLFVTARKVRADSVGKETEEPMDDWIDIGLFAKAPARPDPKIDEKIGVPLYLAKHRIRSGAQRITVVIDTIPYRAGIDPLHKLIDRIASDNTVGVRNRTRDAFAPRGTSVSAPRAPGDPARPSTPASRGPVPR